MKALEMKYVGQVLCKKCRLKTLLFISTSKFFLCFFRCIIHVFLDDKLFRNMKLLILTSLLRLSLHSNTTPIGWF
jgi:hypothetical protein